MGAIGIAKGSKQRALAEKYINYSLAVAPQKLNAETMYIGPTNRGVQFADDVAKPCHTGTTSSAWSPPTGTSSASVGISGSSAGTGRSSRVDRGS